MSMMTVAPEIDELLYQSVVDDEFRAELLENPAKFGLDSGSFLLPDPVEPQDHALLEVGLAAVDVYRCGTTCSYGPWTLVCDGATK